MANDRQQRAARAEQMRKERESAERRQRNLITAAIVGVVVVIVVLAGFAIKTVADDNRDSTDLVAPNGTNDDYGFMYTADDVEAAPESEDAAADEDASTEPVQVVLTEDFQCPACASFEAQTGPFLQSLVASGDIEIEYRPVAFLDNASSNEYSSRSLNAAMCVLDADGVGAYKQMHDLLYARQPAEGGAGPDDDELFATAQEAGYTGSAECIDQKRFGPWISDAYEALVDDGFGGTPWVRVAGEEVPNPTPATIQAAIDEARAS